MICLFVFVFHKGVLGRCEVEGIILGARVILGGGITLGGGLIIKGYDVVPCKVRLLFHRNEPPCNDLRSKTSHFAKARG